MANFMTANAPLAQIERIQIYINSPRKSVAQIKVATGADFIINGTLYNMRTGAVNCHMKASGTVYGKPNYSVRGLAWDTGPDIHMAILPQTSVRNYIACTPLINGGKAIPELTYDPGQGGVRGRSAIGLKGGCLYLYCTKDGSAYARSPERLRDDLVSAGWTDAIMLDGGASSQGDFAGTKVTSTRKVQHLILVYLKKDKSSCPYPEPATLVRTGSRGDGARWVQWQLNRHGANLTVDGMFGAKSGAELREFQISKGLLSDGICGPATRAKLKA